MWPRLITAIDIGTSAIKALVGLKEPSSSDIQMVGQIMEPSSGVRRGVVIKPSDVSKKIVSILQRIQEEASQKINSVYVNIGGGHLFLMPAHGQVAVSRADGKISQEDVERVLQTAQSFALPPNTEILDVFPKEFVVDGRRGIKEAVGMQGVKLEADIFTICAFSPYYKNLTSAVLNSSVQIEDLIPSALASAAAVLSSQEKELGAAVLDIGAGTADLAVFEEGELIHVAVLPIGSGKITDDIAIGLRTEIDIAEKIKKEFGSCVFQKSRKNVKITPVSLGEEPTTESEEAPIIFSHKLLLEIIEARVTQIFGEVDKELKKISRQGLLPGGIVLTGGGVKLPGIVEFAKRKLKLPARIGHLSKTIIGLQEDPCWATACGLMLGATSLETELPSLAKGFFNRIRRVFRIFVP